MTQLSQQELCAFNDARNLEIFLKNTVRNKRFYIFIIFKAEDTHSTVLQYIIVESVFYPQQSVHYLL